MVEPVKIGPSGGIDGQEFSICNVKHIERIALYCGLVIDGMFFTYTDNTGNKSTYKIGGGTVGTVVTRTFEEYMQKTPPTKMITFAKDEYITSISGRYGIPLNYGKPWTDYYSVHELVFKTNVRSYGPYGFAKEGISFYYSTMDRKIAGFHGVLGTRAPGALTAIGIYLYPVRRMPALDYLMKRDDG